MPSDASAELTGLQEEEGRAVEGRRRRLATLPALQEGARRRGVADSGVEARMRDVEGGIAGAEREVAAIREKVVAAGRALPADLRDDGDEA